MVIQFINQQEMDKMNKRRKNMRVAKMLGKKNYSFCNGGIDGIVLIRNNRDDSKSCRKG